MTFRLKPARRSVSVLPVVVNSTNYGVRIVGLGGALAVTLGPHPAWSFPDPGQLEWDAPLECPQRVDVEEGVRRLLGEDREVGSGAKFEGRITEAPEGGWSLELKVNGPAGARTRELAGASCHELTEAGIAVIALALSDAAAQSGAPNASEAVPEPTSAAAPPVIRQPKTTPKDAGVTPADEPDGAWWGAHAAMVVDFDTMPEYTVGAALGVSFSVHSLWLSAQAIYLPPQYAELNEDRGAEISLAAGSINGCYWAFEGTLATGPCVKFEAGVLPAQGISDQGTSGSGRWAAAVPGMVAHWRLASTWALILGAELVIPLIRDEFMLGADQVYRVPAVSGRVTLGPEVRFQ